MQIVPKRNDLNAGRLNCPALRILELPCCDVARFPAIQVDLALALSYFQAPLARLWIVQGLALSS